MALLCQAFACGGYSVYICQTFIGALPTDHLRWYSSQAELPEMLLGDGTPEMPPEGHKSHRNRLSVIPAPYRRLESMHTLTHPSWDFNVDSFLYAHVPSHKLKIGHEHSRGSATMPCPPYVYVPPTPLSRPKTVREVSWWVNEYPLRTAQCVMHHSFRESMDYIFDFDSRNDPDHDILATLVFGHIDGDEAHPPACLVFVQPPWILSPKDLELFVDCQTLRPAADDAGFITSYSSKERLWSKVWDECHRRNCRWFVLTTYWGWVFGAFSQGWTVGFSRGILDRNCKYPTVLESLVYWLGSSIGVPGSWEIPEVPESVQNLDAQNKALIPHTHRLDCEPAPSVSDWDARSEAPSSKFDVPSDDEDDQAVYAMLFEEKPNVSLRQPVNLQRRGIPDGQIAIHTWSRATAGEMRPPSPTRSEFSVASGSTVRDYGKRAVAQGGGYLSGKRYEQPRGDYR